jgi:hypothetical protein
MIIRVPDVVLTDGNLLTQKSRRLFPLTEQGKRRVLMCKANAYPLLVDALGLHTGGYDEIYTA